MRASIIIGLSLILALAGCGMATPDGNDQVAISTDSAAELEQPATAAQNNAGAASSTPAKPSASLSAYAGKYPGDKVAGKQFLDNPLVKAAIYAAVPDAENRDFIYGTSGLEVPIFEKAGRLVAWGAAWRAEDLHNWAVAISPDGSEAEVCIFKARDFEPSAENQASQWFSAGKPSYWTDGQCPDSAEDYPPKEAGPL